MRVKYVAYSARSDVPSVVAAFLNTNISGDVFVSKIEKGGRLQIYISINAVDCRNFERERKLSQKMIGRFTKENE